MPHYKLTERSYINGCLRDEGAVVSINDDPDNGGMTPGSNMIPCNDDGSDRAKAAPARGKKAKAESSDDLM